MIITYGMIFGESLYENRKGAYLFPDIRVKNRGFPFEHFKVGICFQNQTLRAFSILLVISMYRSATRLFPYVQIPSPDIPVTRRKSFLSIDNIDIIVSMAVTTTISISRDTKALLRKMGEKGESFDAIIRKLLREANWKVLDERWNNIVDEDEFIPLEAL